MSLTSLAQRALRFFSRHDPGAAMAGTPRDPSRLADWRRPETTKPAAPERDGGLGGGRSGKVGQSEETEMSEAAGMPSDAAIKEAMEFYVRSARIIGVALSQWQKRLAEEHGVDTSGVAFTPLRVGEAAPHPRSPSAT